MIFSTKSYLICITITIVCIVLSYFYIDKSVSLYFIEHAETYKHFGKSISILGESHWYIITAILGMLYFTYIEKKKVFQQRFLFLLYANLLSGVISIVTKMLFGRLRPWKLENGGEGFGFLIAQHPHFSFVENIHYQITMMMQNSTHYTSFPSGHTTTVMAVFTYISLLFPRYILLWALFAFIGIAGRILANDHFISDVLAGALVGVLSTLFIYSKMKEKIEKVY